MSVSKIANRYAKSFIDLGKEKNQLDELISDLKSFLEMTANKDFSVFLKSPIINADKKLNVFNAMFEDKVHEETMAFFRMVVRKGRENILPQIIQNVLDRYNQRLGITKVNITSASQLSENEINKITEKLKKSSLVIDRIEFVKNIDPALLGGFIIEIGDKLIDASIAGKMKKIRKELN